MQKLLVQTQESLAGLETEKMLMLAALFLVLVVLLVFGECLFRRRGHRHGQAAPWTGARPTLETCGLQEGSIS